MVHHLEAHSDRYITDFAILTGRQMWGQYAALSAEAAQLLDRRLLGNLPDFVEPTKRGCGKFGSAPR
jgi:hypothetical protein